MSSTEVSFPYNWNLFEENENVETIVLRANNATDNGNGKWKSDRRLHFGFN